MFMASGTANVACFAGFIANVACFAGFIANVACFAGFIANVACFAGFIANVACFAGVWWNHSYVAKIHYCQCILWKCSIKFKYIIVPNDRVCPAF